MTESSRFGSPLLLLLVSVIAILCCGSVTSTDVSDNEIVSTTRDDFVLIDSLSDGEVERRVKFHGVLAKETAVPFGSQPDKGPRLWQVVDGKRFIQLIYDETHQLVDCEYVNNAEMAAQFRHEFTTETEAFAARAHVGNVTLRHVTSVAEMDPGLRDMVNYRHLRRDCKRLHKTLKAAMRGQGGLDFNKAQREDVDRTRNLGRRKRASTTRFEALMPGTKWCGSGSSAGEWQDVGSYTAADACCRQHDHCPFKVNGLATNYSYFNYRLFTVSHCDCDERFRTCLKMANTAASNMVGKIFFNIVQTKCFVLKPEKTCTQRSWWGKCLKTELEKRAHVRDPLKY